MFCKKCGTKMEENELFCSNCGEKVESQEISTNTKNKILKKRGYIPAISIVVIIVLLAVSIVLINPFEKSSDQVIYLKGSDMMFTDGKMKNPQIISSSFYADEMLYGKYTDEMLDGEYLGSSVERASLLLNQSYVKSKDGKFAFYIDNFNKQKYSIFKAPINNMEKRDLIADNAIEIASEFGTSFFKLTNNDNGIIYKKYGYDNAYFYSDFETEKKIISDGEIVATDDTGKIIYKEYDENAEGSKLYFMDIIASPETPKLIDEGFIDLLETEDASNPLDIYYIAETSPGLENGRSVKIYKDGVSTELFGNCEYALKNIYDGGVYVNVAKTQSIDFASMINDDMIQSDKNIKEPSKDEYTTTVPETDFWFGTYYGKRVDWDAYNAAYKKYNEKIMRDNIRTYIKNKKHTYNVYDVYYVKDGKSTLVTDKYSGEVFADNDGLVFKETDYSKSGVVKMSDISKELGIYYYDYQLESKFNSMISETSNEKLLYKGEVYNLSEQPKESHFTNIMDCGNSNKVLAVRGDFYSGNFELLEFNLDTEKEEISEIIIDTNLTMAKTSNDESTIYYYKSNENEAFYNEELVMYKDDEIKTISDNVTMGSCMFAESGDIYFISDYENNNVGGDLMKYSNGELTKIATNVMQYYITSKNEVYYLADVDKFGNGTLFKKEKLDPNAKTKEVDTGVSALKGMGSTYNVGFEVFDVHKINLETETF